MNAAQHAILLAIRQFKAPDQPDIEAAINMIASHGDRIQQLLERERVLLQRLREIQGLCEQVLAAEETP